MDYISLFDLVEKTVISKAAVDMYSSIKGLLSTKKENHKGELPKIQDNLNFHLQFIQNWASTISFRDMPQSKKLEKVYINLNIRLTPLRLQFDEEDERNLQLGYDRISHENQFYVDSIFGKNDEEYFNAILLGHPGAGKTTSMKRICHLVFYDESFYPDLFKIPIVIRLRDLNKENEISIFKNIENILGLEITDTEVYLDEKGKLSLQKEVIKFLDTLGVLIIIDGFDELEKFEAQPKVLEEIRSLSEKLTRSRFILTSRSSDYNFDIPGTRIFEIKSLSRSQIAEFAEKWLNNHSLSTDFIQQLYKSPFSDTAIRPLNLSHICVLFERIGKIPEKPKTVYRKIVNLALEEWDQQRLIRRSSKYGKFETDRKFEFISTIAYYLSAEFQQTVFTERELNIIYQLINDDFNLPKNEAKKVIDEVETHNGLILKSGYEKYEFAHKSLQEYLTAEYIVRLHSIPSNIEILLRIPNELALVVSISSQPSKYLTHLILEKFKSLNKMSELIAKSDKGAINKFSLIEEFNKIAKTEESILIKSRIDSISSLNKVKFTHIQSFIRTFFNRIVIERPDFSVSPGLGIAIAYITKIDRFYRYEKIKNYPNIRESIASLSEFYKIKHKDDSHYFVEKTANIQSLAAYPTELTISNALIDEKDFDYQL